MLSVKQGKALLKILIPIFIFVLSIFVLSVQIPKTRFITSTLDSLDKSKNTVIEFSGATIATSLALSALPDDFASPLAATLSEMNKYFVFILVIIFVERLIVVEGTKIVFLFIIPAVCAGYLIHLFWKKQIIKSITYRLFVLGMATFLVVPCSVHFTNWIGKDYIAYVDETISETNSGADKINEIMTSDNDGTIFERLTDAFSNAVESVKDLLSYFNNVIKKCINSIAILIVTSFVVPIAIFAIFRWILKELFSIDLQGNKTIMALVSKKRLGKKTLEEYEVEE